MRGSDQAFAPISDAGNNPESGEARPARTDTPPTDAELGRALTLSETDPEHIAYRLWNAGKLDEAIQFLEREIAAERGRHRETALVPATGPDMRPVQPASDWRERHQAALTKTDFNAFGATVHTIDVTATPTDAILGHAARRPSRRTWIMGLVVAAGLAAAGMAVWAPPGDRQLAAAPDSTPEPISQALAAVTERATVDDSRDSTQPAAGNTLAVAPDAEVIEAPPPETEVVETPPPNPNALAELPPPPAGAAPTAPADDSASKTTLPGELPSEPPTTASVGPDRVAEEQATALEAPLPRPRPEPSPEIAALNAQPAPDVIPEPPVTGVGVDVVPDVVPVYGPNGVRIYRPVRRLAGAPQRLPPAEPFFHPALTPAEYQALLERRAWAQHYAAQRRAGAAPRIITLP